MSEVRGDGHQEGSQRGADQDSILEASLLLRLRDARALRHFVPRKSRQRRLMSLGEGDTAENFLRCARVRIFFYILVKPN